MLPAPYLLHRVISLDPRFALANALAARCGMFLVTFGC
jgi:hypothetical protein